MELQKQAVEQVLEALSPALTAELERVLLEARKAQEAEFAIRLQNAVRDAEAATRSICAIETEKAVDEARESERKQVIDEQQKQFAKVLAENNTNLRVKFDTEFNKAQAEWTSERERMQQQIDQWRVFAEAQRQLTDAGSQPEILIRWLKLAEPFGSSIAIYTAKADGLAFWKSRGKAVFPEIISSETTDPESYFKTIVVRDKVVAAVCAISPYRAEVLDFLVTTMERAIELFGLKLRVPAFKPRNSEPARIS